MLNKANIATCKNIVKQATDRLGIDYLDSNFSLFSENDQEAEQWLSFLKTAVEETAQDLFDKRVSLEQKYISIVANRSPESDRTGQDIWVYSLLNTNIFRIYEVYGNNTKLYRINKLEDLKQNEYILNLLNLKTKTRYQALSLLVAPNTFYAVNVDNSLSFVEQPIGDEDFITLDKELVINKLAYLYGNLRGLQTEAMACLERYNKRLLYIIEESFEDSKPIIMC